MSSAMPSILDDQFCYENGVLIVTTGYYRFSLSFSLVISIISATYLIYFFHRHYRNLSFHWNIKVLLFSLYLCCFLYACLNIFMKVHYLLLPFLLSTPCQIFLPLIVYLCTHLPVIFILFISQYIQIAMIFERCVATISVQNYEYGYRKLAVMLLVAAVIATLVTMLVLYQGERFDGLYLNGRMLPLGTYKVANLVIIVLLCVNFVGLVSAIVLHFINRKRRIRTTLSSKFQTLENRVTSDLLFWVSSIQFATFVLTDIATLIVRIFLPGSRFATAFKENADLFNIYSLFLPILTTTYLTKVKKRRITDIRNNVNHYFMHAPDEVKWERRLEELLSCNTRPLDIAYFQARAVFTAQAPTNKILTLLNIACQLRNPTREDISYVNPRHSIRLYCNLFLSYHDRFSAGHLNENAIKMAR